MLTIPPPNSKPSSIDQLTPVTIFTGFLGSGKTTVISNLVKQLQEQGEIVSYIKNEVGDQDLDAKLLGGQHIVARELLNGCICCTLTGPFLEAVDEIINTYHPNRILVESSGTAEPANFAVTINGHSRVYRDGVVAVIDCLNFGGYDHFSEYAKMQAKLTDLILLNKTELVDQVKLESVVDRIKDYNDYSPIVMAPKGEVNSRLVFGVNSKQLDLLLANQGPNKHQHPDVSQLTLHPTQIFDQHQLEELLKRLPDDVVRVKGVVNTTQGLMVVNGVYKRTEFFSPPDSILNNPPFLILIGLNLETHQGQIKELFGD